MVPAAAGRTGFGLAVLLLQVGIDLRLLGVGLVGSRNIGLRMPTWAGQWTAEPSKKVWRGGEEEESEKRGHSSRRQQHLHSFSPRSRGLMPFSSLVIFVLVWTSIIDVSAFQTSHPPPSSVGSVYKCWCPDVRRPVVISKEFHQFPSYLSPPSRGVLLCALRITPLLLGSLSPWLSLSKHKGEEPPSGELGKSARLSRGAKLDSNTAARLWTLRRSAKSTSSVSPRATTLELSGTWRASDNGDAGGEVIPKNAKTKSFDEACEAYPQRWRVEGEGKYEQTSSFRFLDGWAETFPSVVDASTGFSSCRSFPPCLTTLPIGPRAKEKLEAKLLNLPSLV